jgi:hypothetical protein
MIRILLVHNRFHFSRPDTWLSYLIRVFTCSKWNHVAIQVDEQVIEAVGKGVCVSSYSDWLGHANQIVLPLLPMNNPDPAAILALSGQPYGFLDLVQHLRYIVATRWNGQPEWKGRNFRGYVCSELAGMLIGKEGFVTPADFEHLPGFLREPEFTTIKK